MYDISFMLPVCDAKREYVQRFLDFRRYGLYNGGDFRVRVVVLIGEDETFYGLNMYEGWEPGIDVEIVRTPYNHVAQKIAYYYAVLAAGDAAKARWHIKVDDDSTNDVTALMARLEEYNSEWPTYLVNDIRYELHSADMSVVKSMGYQHWTSGNYLSHEREVSILSHGAMTLLGGGQSNEFLCRRCELASGFGDQCLGIALKFAKVYAVEVNFMTDYPLVSQATLFGGKLAHVHYFLQHEWNHRAYNFFKAGIDALGLPPAGGPQGVFRLREGKRDMEYLFHADGRVAAPKTPDHKIGHWLADGGRLSVSFAPKNPTLGDSVFEFIKSGTGYTGENHRLRGGGPTFLEPA